ncbi:hypothetical protein TNCV_3173321 [Trichonephila clavipes]|nr:hypothetical protein TNCV_3173321 [Trichonephila clavipes]
MFLRPYHTYTYLVQFFLQATLSSNFAPSRHSKGFGQLYPWELKELLEIPADGFFVSLRHKQDDGKDDSLGFVKCIRNYV